MLNIVTSDNHVRILYKYVNHELTQENVLYLYYKLTIVDSGQLLGTTCYYYHASFEPFELVQVLSVLSPAQGLLEGEMGTKVEWRCAWGDIDQVNSQSRSGIYHTISTQ